MSSLPQTLAERLRAWGRTLGEVIYGMTGHEFAHHARHMRADLETLFILLVMGDFVGIPVLPPYYSLRLVPHLVPTVEGWRRRVLRERDHLENEEFDLIEM